MMQRGNEIESKTESKKENYLTVQNLTSSMMAPSTELDAECKRRNCGAI